MQPEWRVENRGSKIGTLMFSKGTLMFSKETVFVLGAGASWHYGYPTGERLVGDVIDMAHRFANYCRERVLFDATGHQSAPEYVEQKTDRKRGTAGALAGWKQVEAECNDLITRLTAVRPLVIDYFLAWNEPLRPIGKMMIAAVILECEARWLHLKANQNRKLAFMDNPVQPTSQEIGRLDITKYHDEWYRFVVHKLVYGAQVSSDLAMNKVHFVTFNYDTSLEFHLFNALSHIDFLKQNHIIEFLATNRISHVYGSVHQGLPLEHEFIDHEVIQTLGEPLNIVRGNLDYQERFKLWKDALDRCLAASQNLKTIDPHDKEEDGIALGQARSWIEQAEVVYVLGYGFDPANSRRIGLRPGPYDRTKDVLYTNYGETLTIRRRADILFHQWNSAPYSTQTVYDAIERDFGALDDR